MSSFTISNQARQGIVGGALVALVAGVVLVLALGGSGADEGASGESDLPPQSFELFDGSAATFADFEGKPLVINFWASWCPSCVAELPDFESAHQRLGDDVAFLGLANADDRSRGLDLIRDTGVTYALGDDPRGDLFRELGGIAMPTTVFVSADGEIIETFAGQLDEAALVERIEKLLRSS